MSKKRLIPKLQLKTSEYNHERMVLVITKQFKSEVEIGDPVSQSKIYQDQGADELIFVNIDRTNKSIAKLSSIITKVSEEIFMPITVGGGVTKEEDFRLLLSSGADKICINSIASIKPNFVTEMSQKFGAQCVVVSIDYKINADGEPKVYINNGTLETNFDPINWALMCEKLGAGEILLTCIDFDGMKSGLDIETAKMVSQSISIPLIVSGGCGLAQHFSEAYLKANVDAVSAGSFFAHRDQNFMQTRSQIKNSGVNIRV